MTHNPLPCVQGLFPIACVVFSYLPTPQMCPCHVGHLPRKEQDLGCSGDISDSYSQTVWGNAHGNISNGKSLPEKMMVISAVTQVNRITERWPATWILWFIVLLVMSSDPWPILPVYRETQTLSGVGVHLKIQNGHGLTAERKQGRVVSLF